MTHTYVTTEETLDKTHVLMYVHSLSYGTSSRTKTYEGDEASSVDT